MNYEILKTGSKGNAIVVENKFLLDCGVSYKLIEPYLKDIKLVFISHIHSDHLNKSTIKRIGENYPNIVFIGNSSVVEQLFKLKIANHIYEIKEDIWFNLKLCKVKLNYLYHDTPNSCLHLVYNDKKLFYATDTSKIDYIEAKDYDLYLIEANYETDEELDKLIVEAKNKGEYTYLERVRHTHLSQLQALNWLDKNVGEHSKFVFIHQHIEDKKECEE